MHAHNYTVFLQSDTAVSIFFAAHSCAATIRGQLLFKGGYYLSTAFISLENVETSTIAGYVRAIQ